MIILRMIIEVGISFIPQNHNVADHRKFIWMASIMDRRIIEELDISDDIYLTMVIIFILLKKLATS